MTQRQLYVWGPLSQTWVEVIIDVAQVDDERQEYREAGICTAVVKRPAKQSHKRYPFFNNRSVRAL
jgi:hypothetical protein